MKKRKRKRYRPGSDKLSLPVFFFLSSHFNGGGRREDGAKGLAFPLRSLHVHSVDHLMVKHQICESRVHLVKFLVHGFDKCTVNCLWSFVFL